MAVQGAADMRTPHDTEASRRWLWRARLLAVCLLLSALTFRQQPGRVVADTKLDLTVDPWGFLSRATHLWDPLGALGQLQNQAYGYLFPMGPFHGVLISAALPPWVVQRLWWSVLLWVAFLGMWRLAGVMGVGNPWTRLAGGLVYALCPRIVSELSITSVEVWPMALAPWVLAPLVDERERPWSRRILLSAAAIAMAGGVNAVATGAILVLPALWFVTRQWSRRTVLAFLSWIAAALVAMAWWLVPLALLGRYSPPFLDWIESSAVTSSTASPFEALRGTSAWLGFLATPLGPDWPGGWSYNTVPALIVVTTAVAAAGLTGIILSPRRHCIFLITGVVVGLALMGLGWSGAWASVASGEVRHLLDGPLAALRNAHKFDLVARIPLALGVVAVLTRLETWSRAHRHTSWLSRFVVVTLLVAASAPILASGSARNQAFDSIPSYWRQAATWLDEQAGDGAVLVLPPSSFGDFTWGSTKDDPLQALMKRPLVLRDAVPLGSAGATRFLDGLTSDIGTGRAGPEVATTLRSAGIAYVVVRHDVRAQAASMPVAAVHASLQSAGLAVGASFGPRLVDGSGDGETVDFGATLTRQMVDVYTVPDVDSARLAAVDDVVRLDGGPEDLPRAHQAYGDATFVLGQDATRITSGTHLVTDGLRRREVNFGATSDNKSHVLAHDEPYRQQRKAHEYEADPSAPRSLTTWAGVRRVTASSSASDADASLRVGPSARPGAALDGDLATRWISGRANDGIGEWLRVDLEGPTDVRQIVLTLSADPPVVGSPASVRVTTTAGERVVPTHNALGPITVSLPQGMTTFVTVTMNASDNGGTSGFAIAELDVVGVQHTEQIEVPAVTDDPTSILLGEVEPGRNGCVRLEGRELCNPEESRDPEGPANLSRRLTLARGGTYAMSGSVRVRPGSASEALLHVPGTIRATASSRLLPGMSTRPGAGVDGDESSAWIASRRDFSPSYTVALPRAREISSLEFVPSVTRPSSAPREITLTFDGTKKVDVVVDAHGRADFAAVRATTVRMDFGATYPLVNIDSSTFAKTYVPVGFGELKISGVSGLTASPPLRASTGAPCGFGPTVTIAGAAHVTKVVGTMEDLLEDRPLRWELCGSGDVELPAGAFDITVEPSAEFRPRDMRLSSPDRATTAAAPTRLATDRESASSLSIDLPQRDESAIVSLPQNFNAGWVATVDGREVSPIRVGGWMQGWMVPAGNAGVLRASFPADSTYRIALSLGGAAWACLLLGVVVAGRRRSDGGVRPPRASLAVAGAVMALAALVSWGWIAAVLGLALATQARYGRSVTTRAALTLVGAGCLGASVIVASRPWPQGRWNIDSIAVQVLVLAAVAISCAAVSARTTRSGRHAGQVREGETARDT